MFWIHCSLSPTFPPERYKAEGIITAKPENVFKCVKPETGGLREKWDQNVKEVVILEAINEVSIMCLHLNPFKPQS